MDRAASFREQAEQFRKLARAAADLPIKEQALDLAARLDCLADTIEAIVSGKDAAQ